jgi:hypothetical protein
MDWGNWTIPDWATTDEALAWFYGFAVGASVRVFRAGLRWVKRIGEETTGGGDGD